MRLGILGSTRGTHLLTLLDACQQNQIDAQIEIVISNKIDALILTRAKLHNIPAVFIDPKGLSREAYDEKISVLLQNYAVDLVVLIGYMRILSQQFVLAWQNKIINVHPSLLPNFSHLMDLAVHRAVLQNDCKETGCTVHYVTEMVDAGPILLQKKCKVLANDTPESLKQRVQTLEGEALIASIKNWKRLTVSKISQSLLPKNQSYK